MKWLCERGIWSGPSSKMLSYQISSDLYHIEIHLQITLVLHDSFLGDWYKASFDMQGLVPKTVWLCWLTTNSDWQIGVENFIIFFQLPTHSSFWCPTFAIHMTFPLSLAYLKTQLHIWFWILKLSWQKSICNINNTYTLQKSVKYKPTREKSW